MWDDTLLFDTNILARNSEVLYITPPSYLILIPEIVIDELVKLSGQANRPASFYASIAESLSILGQPPPNIVTTTLNSIKYYHRVIGETGSIMGRLLVDDTILAIALQYELMSPLLVTNDCAMRGKADRLEIRNFNYRKFYNEILKK